MSGQLAATPTSILGSEPSLLTILALLFLWISGAFQRAFPPAAPARLSTISLGAPRLVVMSPADAAAAAQLLGSSVAAQMVEWREP